MLVDRSLVERAQRGDREAYETLARASARRLFQTAYRIVRDTDRADDAVQQALVAIWLELPSLRGPDRFVAWSYRMVVRFCMSEGRRARRVGVREIPIDEMTPAHHDGYAEADLRDQLERALRSLSIEHRTVVVLHHYAGLTLAEVAEVVGVPYGTARSRMHHAMAELRAAIAAGDRTPIVEGQTA